ncbi:28S ribosomal protein S35, mitochondrial-like [Anneissia japonica]|uniref:28S ribosomal protein S35, mitochondrial-like n=1 Tax=Anneissia japonica TaxID=1529436 RepID=UPI00142590EE|nr:28S ribosomal protein S35, mitochondrial-like [Anneissia japonica]
MSASRCFHKHLSNLSFFDVCRKLNAQKCQQLRQCHYGSLVSTSLPDVQSEIDRSSHHSQRGKAMRALDLRLRRKQPLPPPRELKMHEDQEWSDVYPTAASFKWSAVPLPIRMGYPVKRGIPPHKYGNAELLKIPNFLHLTPPAIKKQCAALKELCTQWPNELKEDAELCQKMFPVEVEVSDYIRSGPSVRHPDARIVSIKVSLDSLPLDKHARWKLIQLVGERYNRETNTITITTDRCPLRKQNYDYAMYLLTVLFHESWVTEPWESDITPDDMEEYVWDLQPSKNNILQTLARNNRQGELHTEISEAEEHELLKTDGIQEYKMAVEAMMNTGEGEDTLNAYKKAVLKLVHSDLESTPGLTSEPRNMDNNEMSSENTSSSSDNESGSSSSSDSDDDKQ